MAQSGVTLTSSSLDSVLSSKGRRPLGYIDVPTLKAKWEGGEVNPVRLKLGSDAAESDEDTRG